MTSWFGNLTGDYSSSAKVINGTLVLSLPDAQSPVVWRMELKDIKLASFEIESSDEENFILLMKTSDKDSRKIAVFDSKAKALKALMAASRAMEQAYGTTKDTAVTMPQKKKKSPLITGIIGVLILVILLFALTQIGPKRASSLSSSASSSFTKTGTGSAAGTPGMPVSAADFLKNR